MAEYEVTEPVITTFCMDDFQMKRISDGDSFDVSRTHNLYLLESGKIPKLSQHLLDFETRLRMKWEKETKSSFDFNDNKFSDEFFAKTVSSAGFENIPFSIYELYVLRFNLTVKTKDLQIRREFIEHNIEILGKVFLMWFVW